MYNAGDFDATETVDIPFNTFSSNDPSASVTVTDLAAADIEIHKDGHITQRTSDAGVTVSIDFDGVTGQHIVHIDLSDNTDVGFYAVGSRFLVRLQGITVDGATLNVWIGGFSVGCTLRPATAGRTVVVDAAGLVDANAVKTGPTGAGTAQTAGDIVAAIITNAAGADVAADIIAVKAVADAIPTTAMRGTDSAALASVATETRLAELDAGNLPTDIDAIPTTAMRGTDSGALATVCTEGRLGELDAANLPTDIGAIPTTVMRGTDSAALATVCTEGRLAELDAANLPADVGAIPTTAMRGTDSGALASVCTEVRLAALTDWLNGGRLDLLIDAIKAKTDALPEGIQKNQAWDLDVLMIDSTDHLTPKTGLTVTCTRSIEGGAFGAIAGSVAEVASGMYRVSFLAADVNGDDIVYRFVATGADDRFITIRTTT